MASRFVDKSGNIVSNRSDDEDEDDMPSTSLRASISRERSALVQKLLSNPDAANGARPSVSSTASSRTEKLLRSAKALKAADQDKAPPQHQRKKSWTSFSSSAAPTGDNAPPLPGHHRKKSLTETLSALAGGKKDAGFPTGSGSNNAGLQPRKSSITVLASPQGSAMRKTVSKTPEGLPRAIPEEGTLGSPPLSQRKAPGHSRVPSDTMVPTTTGGPLPSAPPSAHKGLGSPTKFNRKATTASTGSSDSGEAMSRVPSAASVASLKKTDAKVPQPELIGKPATAAAAAPGANGRIESRTTSLIRRLSAGRPSFLSSSNTTKMAVSSGNAPQSKTSSASTGKEDNAPLPRVTPQRRLLMRMHSSNTAAPDDTASRPGAMLDREIKRKQDQDETKELSSLMERFGTVLTTT